MHPRRIFIRTETCKNNLEGMGYKSSMFRIDYARPQSISTEGNTHVITTLHILAMKGPSGIGLIHGIQNVYAICI